MPASKERWWLTRDSRQIVISTSPGRIYGLISDLPRMGEWSPECERVEWTGGTTAAAEGARFVGHTRGVVAAPGREFAFVTEEGGRESTVWRYRLDVVEGGTRVTESYEVRWIPAWARMLDIPTNRHRELHEAMAHTLGRLKTAAEAPDGWPGQP